MKSALIANFKVIAKMPGLDIAKKDLKLSQKQWMIFTYSEVQLSGKEVQAKNYEILL